VIHFPNPRYVWRKVGEDHIKSFASSTHDFTNKLWLGDIADDRHHIPVLEGGYCLFVDAEYESRFANRLASCLKPTARCSAEIQHPLA
jgi:hypothetical protein